MTIHLIAVGRSVLDSFQRPDRDLLGRDLTGTLRSVRPGTVLRHAGDSSRAVSAQLAAWFGPDGFPDDELVERIDQATPGTWPIRISAELETFVRVRDGVRTVTGEELVVLLATDTVDGLVAAMWNAVTMVSPGDLIRVRYFASPDDLAQVATALPDRPAVIVVRVPNLDASGDEKLQDAMRGLGVLGRALLPAPGEPAASFEFHLSGGFRAALPYLIGLAEGLRSLPIDTVASVQARVLHETTEGAVIRLPLRKLNAQWIRDELKGFAHKDEAGPPAGRYLEGYAYETDRTGRCRITAFGRGLLELVGAPSEPVDG